MWNDWVVKPDDSLAYFFLLSKGRMCFMGRATYDVEKRKELFQKANWKFYQDKDKRWIYELPCGVCKMLKKSRFSWLPTVFIEASGLPVCKKCVRPEIKRLKLLSGMF